MAAPETEAREVLREILTTTFPTVTYYPGRLHASTGDLGPLMATSPEETIPNRRDQLVLETTILVQFFGTWQKEIDNMNIIDPAWIEAQAEAFRLAIQPEQSQNQSDLWYLAVTRLRYPPDPTGQKTRFEALVLARSNNTAVVETGP
jgi:hypothetical protein